MQAQKVDTIVHGGTVVTSTATFAASVAIKGERIAAVGPRELMPPADHSIDATGKFVLPGLIDCHVHLRPAGGDDWSVGPKAAAHAGLTTIIPFAGYNRDAQETLPQAITRLKAEAEHTSVVDFGLHFILGNTPYILNSLPEAIGMGVTSYKMFMTYDNRSPDSLIARVMEIVGPGGGVMQLHCENGDVIEHLMNKAQAEGRVKPTDFPATCPPWAEAEAINRACLLGAMTGCPTYVVHLSTKLGLERIMQAQSQGQRVWTETCPQYLLLDEG
jgi:dihydropyrimidinase